MISVLFINANERTLTTKIDFDETDFLASAYALLGCDLVEAVYLDNGDILWIDEEGLLKEGNLSFQYGDQILFGNAFIINCVSGGGNDTYAAPRTPIQDIAVAINFDICFVSDGQGRGQPLPNTTPEEICFAVGNGAFRPLDYGAYRKDDRSLYSKAAHRAPLTNFYSIILDVVDGEPKFFAQAHRLSSVRFELVKGSWKRV